MYKAVITVTLRPVILDPQGKTIEYALHSVISPDIANVRVGKRITMDVNALSADEAQTLVENACKKLLANPVMEDYTFTVEKA